MDRRLSLQRELEEILGSRNVYFQPPENIKMNYPCIVYALSRIDLKYANNQPYTIHNRYTLTLIDRNPDTKLVSKIIKLPTCSYDRHFVSKNLNHYVFNIYY